MANPTVLVADDSPLVLRMVERILGESGFGVVTARDGLEAIEKAFAEDVSLIILDVTMPRLNGYQACRLLKSDPATKSVPVVILTSKDKTGDRFWGLETGADYYLTKSAGPEQILDLVKRVLLDRTSPTRPRPAEARGTSMDILSRVNELLDRKLYEATILSEIGRIARGLVHFDETFTSVMVLVARVVDFTVGGMAFVEDEDLEVVLTLQRDTTPGVLEKAKSRLLQAVAKERHGVPFTKVQARLVTSGSVKGMPEKSLGGFASFPITTNGRLTGLLALAGEAVDQMSAETEVFLGQVANQAHIVMENSRLFERVRNLSIRDSLTDLFNHRHSIELVASEFERVGRYEGGVSLVMADIDHFKKINDEYGHPAGDIVLREVARLLRDTLRNVDFLGRYGGEEFIAILPHTGHDEARQTAERLRKSVENHAIRVGDKELRITVSLGVATYPGGNIDTPNALVGAADQALYRAKEAGRNRVA